MRETIETISCDRCHRRLRTVHFERGTQSDPAARTVTDANGRVYDLCPECVQRGWEFITTPEGFVILGKREETPDAPRN